MWKAFLTAFGLVFLAELGDKTQLAVMLLSSQKRAPVIVFWGATCALAMSTLIGVIAGSWLTRVVPQYYLRIGAGAMFVVMGIFILFGKI